MLAVRYAHQHKIITGDVATHRRLFVFSTSRLTILNFEDNHITHTTHIAHINH
jgi:hypothetical protein